MSNISAKFSIDAKKTFLHLFQQGCSDTFKKENNFSQVIIFFYFYLCFNILITALAQHEKPSLTQDRSILNWIKSNNNELKSVFNKKTSNNKFLAAIAQLKSSGPISDLRQNRSRTYEIKDPKNLGEILEFLYQIRCNLFHGRKNIKEMNARTIEHAYMVIKLWLEPINEELRKSK